MRYGFLAALLVGFTLAACGKSGGTASTSPGTGDKIKEDVKALGHDIKDAATEAAADAKPAMQSATAKGKELLHNGAQKVADWTATQPGTMPATQQ